jgi:hypothetical protein
LVLSIKLLGKGHCSTKSKVLDSSEQGVGGSDGDRKESGGHNFI